MSERHDLAVECAKSGLPEGFDQKTVEKMIVIIDDWRSDGNQNPLSLLWQLSPFVEQRQAP